MKKHEKWLLEITSIPTAAGQEWAAGLAEGGTQQLEDVGSITDYVGL